MASEVPAAVFQKEFCAFTDTPRLDEFTTNLVDDVATALVSNKLGDIIIHLRSLLAAYSFPNDAKPFVQGQFPVGGQPKESDSRLDQFAADLAIAISFQGMAFPIVFLEHKSDDKKPPQQLFWQGISYFSHIDSYLRQMEDVAVFCPRLLIGLTPTSLSAHAVAPAAAAGSKLGHSTIFREKKTVETARKVVHALLNSLSGIFQKCKFTTMVR